MKVTNNRAKSATVFYKVQGKMKKMKLLPFETLSITDLNDINAVRNNMVIANFIGSDRTPYYNSISATSTTAIIINTAYTFNDGVSVTPKERVDTGFTYNQGNMAAHGSYSAATPVATFSRRKTPTIRQTKGRFEVKYR